MGIFFFLFCFVCLFVCKKFPIGSVIFCCSKCEYPESQGKRKDKFCSGTRSLLYCHGVSQNAKKQKGGKAKAKSEGETLGSSLRKISESLHIFVSARSVVESCHRSKIIKIYTFDQVQRTKDTSKKKKKNQRKT